MSSVEYATLDYVLDRVHNEDTEDDDSLFARSRNSIELHPVNVCDRITRNGGSASGDEDNDESSHEHTNASDAREPVDSELFYSAEQLELRSMNALGTRFVNKNVEKAYMRMFETKKTNIRPALVLMSLTSLIFAVWDLFTYANIRYNLWFVRLIVSCTGFAFLAFTYTRVFDGRVQRTTLCAFIVAAALSVIATDFMIGNLGSYALMVLIMSVYVLVIIDLYYTIALCTFITCMWSAFIIVARLEYIDVRFDPHALESRAHVGVATNIAFNAHAWENHYASVAIDIVPIFFVNAIGALCSYYSYRALRYTFLRNQARLRQLDMTTHSEKDLQTLSSCVLPPSATRALEQRRVLVGGTYTDAVLVRVRVEGIDELLLLAEQRAHRNCVDEHTNDDDASHSLAKPSASSSCSSEPLRHKYTQMTHLETVANIIDAIHCEFDTIVDAYGAEKLSCTHNTYVCVSSLASPSLDSCELMVSMALDMRNFIEEMSKKLHYEELAVRVGVSIGTIDAMYDRRCSRARFEPWGAPVDEAGALVDNMDASMINSVHVSSRVAFRLTDSDFHIAHDTVSSTYYIFERNREFRPKMYEKLKVLEEREKSEYQRYEERECVQLLLSERNIEPFERNEKRRVSVASVSSSMRSASSERRLYVRPLNAAQLQLERKERSLRRNHQRRASSDDDTSAHERMSFCAPHSNLASHAYVAEYSDDTSTQRTLTSDGEQSSTLRRRRHSHTTHGEAYEFFETVSSCSDESVDETDSRHSMYKHIQLFHSKLASSVLNYRHLRDFLPKSKEQASASLRNRVRKALAQTSVFTVADKRFYWLSFRSHDTFTVRLKHVTLRRRESFDYFDDHRGGFLLSTILLLLFYICIASVDAYCYYAHYRLNAHEHVREQAFDAWLLQYTIPCSLLVFVSALLVCVRRRQHVVTALCALVMCVCTSVPVLVSIAYPHVPSFATRHFTLLMIFLVIYTYCFVHLSVIVSLVINVYAFAVFIVGIAVAEEPARYSDMLFFVPTLVVGCVAKSYAMKSVAKGYAVLGECRSDFAQLHECRHDVSVVLRNAFPARWLRNMNVEAFTRRIEVTRSLVVYFEIVNYSSCRQLFSAHHKHGRDFFSTLNTLADECANALHFEKASSFCGRIVFVRNYVQLEEVCGDALTLCTQLAQAIDSHVRKNEHLFGSAQELSWQAVSHNGRLVSSVPGSKKMSYCVFGIATSVCEQLLRNKYCKQRALVCTRDVAESINLSRTDVRVTPHYTIPLFNESHNVETFVVHINGDCSSDMSLASVKTQCIESEETKKSV